MMMTRSGAGGADLCATRLSRAVGAHCNQLKFSIAYISTFLNNFVSRILWSKLGNQASSEFERKYFKSLSEGARQLIGEFTEIIKGHKSDLAKG